MSRKNDFCMFFHLTLGNRYRFVSSGSPADEEHVPFFLGKT